MKPVWIKYYGLIPMTKFGYLVTLGVVGLGRIGRSLSVRVKALGMKVIAHDAFPNETFVRQQEIEMVPLDELLARSDYLSLHCPASTETCGIINRKTLTKMKPGSTLINQGSNGRSAKAGRASFASTSPRHWGAEEPVQSPSTIKCEAMSPSTRRSRP